MVLDPMSALSIAASVIQFVDFSSKLVSKGYHIYRSADGTLVKNLELEVITDELLQLVTRLGCHRNSPNTTSLSPEEQALHVMAEKCNGIATELLNRLAKLKVKKDANFRGWKSFRQALKSVWSKDELDELSERLSGFRDQMQFQILFSMKESSEILALRQSERFDSLDASTQTLVQALLDNRAIFTSNISSQTTTIAELHVETRALIESEARKTRAEIVGAFKSSENISSRQNAKISGTSRHPTRDLTVDESRIQNIILQSLRFPAMHDRYDAIEESHAETFEWIFDERDSKDRPWDDFSCWLRSAESLYWVCGKAGSGKSTLLRYISDDPRLHRLLQEWAGGSEDLVIGKFFFWISGTPDQASQVGLLRSLLYELLSSRPHLIQSTMTELWSDLVSSISAVDYALTYSWTLSKVTKAFRRLISQDIGHVFLLIDGLDEYYGDPADIIKILMSTASPKVKVCASSRPWQVFEDAFRSKPKLRLQDITFGDISRYVNDILRSDDKMQELFIISPIEAPKLVDEIVTKANGVFLWVTLVVRSFLSGLTNRDQISHLRKRIEEIPSKIEDLYTYMLTKIDPIYYEEGCRIFSTVELAMHKEANYEAIGVCAIHLSFAIADEEILIAPRKLLCEEEAIRRVDWIDNRLKVCCAGLLELPNNSSTRNVCFHKLGNRPVQYIHETAKAFLATRQSKITSIRKHLSTTYHPPTALMRANVLYVKHCIDTDADRFSSKRGNGLGIQRLFKNIMWLARNIELETSQAPVDILDELEGLINDSADNFPFAGRLSRSIRWSSMMPDKIKASWSDITSHELDRCDDYISVVIAWGLNMYLESRLGGGSEFLEKKRGMSYLHYATWIRRIIPDVRCNIKTLTILLEHGANPNSKYDANEEISTPWQTILFDMWKMEEILKISPFKKTGFWDYYGLAKYTSSAEVAPIVAQLLEMFLLCGADPYVKFFPSSSQIRYGSPIFVSDIVATVFKVHNVEKANLLKLLESLQNAKVATENHTSKGKLSRLRARPGFRK